MTTSGNSPVSDVSLRRRSLLGGIGGVGGAVALSTLGFGSAAAAADPPTPATFDFDTDIALDLMFPTDATIRESSSLRFFAPMDVTLFIWFTQSTVIAWFDAVAPYHPTAVGVHTRIRRRPASESTTNRNMNIALFHASYQVLKSAVPDQAPLFGQVMASVGLDPNDESLDPTTPVGIGNLAGRGTAQARVRDGFNMLGDIGRRYNPQPFRDYTGYEPVNTAFELRNPSRWQPQMTPHRRRLGAGPGDKGIYTIQHFVTPQMRLARPYSFKSPAQFKLPPPDHTDHHRRSAYKRSVDEIIEASAALTDKQKVMAEFFDNKLIGIGQPPAVVARKRNLDLHSWVHLLTIHNTAVYDALVAIWHQKVKYDAVRPFSAIKHVYGSRRLTAWGGPGKGTVSDVPADQWGSYLNVADHPEYPSGSTTLCAAEAQAVRRYFGDDVLDWRFPIPAGWALVEPGITPANDMELYWATWTDLVKDCGMSRVWGGVHFRKTVERSIAWGEQFGDLAYDYLRKYIDGDVKA